jgi:hypothetical protein
MNGKNLLLWILIAVFSLGILGLLYGIFKSPSGLPGPTLPFTLEGIDATALVQSTLPPVLVETPDVSGPPILEPPAALSATTRTLEPASSISIGQISSRRSRRKSTSSSKGSKKTKGSRRSAK